MRSAIRGDVSGKLPIPTLYPILTNFGIPFQLLKTSSITLILSYKKWLV